MEKKRNKAWRFLAAVAFCLLSIAGCDLCPEPISRYNLGQVYVGTVAETPQVCWRNHSENALEVVAVTTDGLPFAVKPASFQSVVLQSGSCTPYFTFTFTPAQEGAFSSEATPQLISGAGTVQAFEMSGTGVYRIAGGWLIIGGGDIKAGQALDFGSVVFRERESVASQRHFELFNAGDKPMQLDVVWSKGKQGFKVVNPSPPITVPKFKRAKVTIEFIPPGVDTFTDGVTFVDRTNSKNKAGTAVRGKGVRGE